MNLLGCNRATAPVRPAQETKYRQLKERCGFDLLLSLNQNGFALLGRSTQLASHQPARLSDSSSPIDIDRSFAPHPPPRPPARRVGLDLDLGRLDNKQRWRCTPSPCPSPTTRRVSSPPFLCSLGGGAEQVHRPAGVSSSILHGPVDQRLTRRLHC